MKNFLLGMVAGMVVVDLGMRLIMNDDKAWNEFVEMGNAIRGRKKPTLDTNALSDHMSHAHLGQRKA